MDGENTQGKGMVCKCPHHKAMPWLLILIGLDFLLGAIGVLPMGIVGIIWPILLIIIGIVKVARCNCCSK
jgi:hypothetical protein